MRLPTIAERILLLLVPLAWLAPAALGQVCRPSFQAAAGYPVPHPAPAPDYEVSVEVADVDNDGTNDLVVGTSADPRGLSILIGDGRGDFNPAKTLSIGPVYGIGAGDLDGDGAVDLVVSQGWWKLSVLLGDGEGSFQAPVVYSLPDFPGRPRLAEMEPWARRRAIRPGRGRPISLQATSTMTARSTSSLST